jgi:hypothetical protein
MYIVSKSGTVRPTELMDTFGHWPAFDEIRRKEDLFVRLNVPKPLRFEVGAPFRKGPTTLD